MKHNYIIKLNFEKDEAEKQLLKEIELIASVQDTLARSFVIVRNIVIVINIIVLKDIVINIVINIVVNMVMNMLVHLGYQLR